MSVPTRIPRPLPRPEPDGQPTSPPARPAPRRTRRWLLVPALVIVLLVLGALAQRTLQTPTPVAAPTPAAPKLTARGEVRPVGQAKVAVLSGGTISRLLVEAGQTVDERQELARVRGPHDEIEVVTAPWRGTITSVPVHYGDTVMAGQTIATVGDLSRLQIETTDVDEFIIGHVRQGQTVTVRVDALDRKAFQGVVRTVQLIPQKDEDGNDHYPVVIDLLGSTTELRLGMTVRIDFAEGAS